MCACVKVRWHASKCMEKSSTRAALQTVDLEMGMTVFENGDGDGDRICRGKVSSRRAVVTRAWKYDIAGGRWSLAMCCASLASSFNHQRRSATRTQQVTVLMSYYVNSFMLSFSNPSSQCPYNFIAFAQNHNLPRGPTFTAPNNELPNPLSRST